jgi:hypothetical protein
MVDAAEATHTDSLTYRILPPQEWAKLVEYCTTKYGYIPPDPAFATASVVEDGDKIVAAHILQVQYHAEPIMIDKDYSGRVNFLNMVKKLEELFFLQEGSKTYYAFSDSRLIDEMAEKAGMKLTPYKVFKKEVA